jgi:hypothetical protein
LVLSQEKKTAFFKDGYIVVEDLLSRDQVDTLRQRYEVLVTGGVPDYPERHISSRDVVGRAAYGRASREQHRDPAERHGPRHDRCGTQVYPRGEEEYAKHRAEPVDDPLDAITKVNVPSRYDAAFDAVVRDPKIVDIIEDLMGPNIKLYYDQVFAKPPYARQSLPSGLRVLEVFRVEFSDHVSDSFA